MAKASKKIKDTPITLNNEIAKLHDGVMRLEMLKNGLKVSYRHLMLPLSVKDGVTQLDLVKITKLKAPTVSTTLRNMEEEGLVSRETDKDDARATRVYLTDKGREIDKRMRSGAAKIEKLFLSPLSPEEHEQLFLLLRKIKEHAEKIDF